VKPQHAHTDRETEGNLGPDPLSGECRAQIENIGAQPLDLM